MVGRTASAAGGFTQGRVVLKITIDEGSSTAAVTKNPVAKFARAPVEREALLFFDESLSLGPSVDLKEIERLSRFLPVIVLVPRSRAKTKLSHAKLRGRNLRAQAPTRQNSSEFSGKPWSGSKVPAKRVCSRLVM